MNTATTTVAQPTTLRLAAAFAQALLPFAGPKGLALSAVTAAGVQLLSDVQAQIAAGKEVYSMDDLEAAAARATNALAHFHQTVDGQGG